MSEAHSLQQDSDNPLWPIGTSGADWGAKRGIGGTDSADPAYDSWQSAALHGNLASYAIAHAPGMADLVPGYSSSEGLGQKILDVGSVPARLVTNALLGPLVQGGSAMQRMMADPSDPGAARDLTGAVLGLAGNGMLVPKPAGALGVFGGASAKTADLGALARAQTMRTNGISPEKIWSSTGWFRGPDKQWKFEIPDEFAEFTSAVQPSMWNKNKVQFSVPSTLGESLAHPDLFAAYPELAGTPLGRLDTDSAINGVKGGVYDDGRIGLASASRTDALSTLLHEVQHKIQDREGFGRGGNSGEFLPPGHAEALNSVNMDLGSFYHRMEQSGIDPRALHDGLGGATDQDAVAAVAQARAILPPEEFAQHLANAAVHGHLAQIQKDAFGKYQSLAGEVESRNVQERHETGDYGVAPWRTPGYPTGPQIVVHQGQPAQLLPVDHDPFGEAGPGYSTTPVDHNPFEEQPRD